MLCASRASNSSASLNTSEAARRSASSALCVLSSLLCNSDEAEAEEEEAPSPALAHPCSGSLFSPRFLLLPKGRRAPFRRDEGAVPAPER